MGARHSGGYYSNPGEKWLWLAFRGKKAVGLYIYLGERVLGQDMGLDVKVFGLRNWKDGSGTAQNGGEERQDKIEREALGHVNFEIALSPSRSRR